MFANNLAFKICVPILFLLLTTNENVFGQGRVSKAANSKPAVETANKNDFVIQPNDSLGKIKLGMSKQEILRVLGKPTQKDKDGFWKYKSAQSGNEIAVYFSDKQVAQITFTSEFYRTRNGLNTQNYADDKFKDLFDAFELQWRFLNLKYVLKTGGLTFYALNGGSDLLEYKNVTIGVVYKGAKPPFEVFGVTDEPDSGWKKYQSNPSNP